jgi:hypothetical protein
MIRKAVHLALLLFVLVPALTGWAGDSCCPPDESRCGSACGEAPHDAGRPDDHDRTDPGHQQALCGCACHAPFTTAGRMPLDLPGFLGRFEPQPHPDHSIAHFSDIFRPPLA